MHLGRNNRYRAVQATDAVSRFGKSDRCQVGLLCHKNVRGSMKIDKVTQTPESPPCHPPRHATPRLQVKHKNTRNVDLHVASLSHWQQCFEQTSAGAFQSEVQELLRLIDRCDDSMGSNLSSGLQLFHEWANRATS